MGRRKIEIQPITHERNRSVTFLKRKNGLFKKAYELGVLCSVDIAVIVFEERPGHHPKLYQYCSTDINELVQRHIRHQGEKDTKAPNDFANSSSSTKFDDDEGDDEEQDDEEEYTPSRATKRRKVKKSARGGANQDGDFENPSAMTIPQPPIMQNASALPVSSDRHAFREGTGFPGAGSFRAGYPAFFPQGAGAPSFMPPGGPWDGRGDYGRQRPGYDGSGNNSLPAGALPPGGLPGGPGNLFAYLEEHQRRAVAAGAPLEWPDSGQGPSQPSVSSADWLDFFRGNAAAAQAAAAAAAGAASTGGRGTPSSAAGNAGGGGGGGDGPAASGERPSSSTAESWERGSGAALPPKLRGGGSAKEGENQPQEPVKEESAAGAASTTGNSGGGGGGGGRKSVNGKGSKNKD